LYFFHRISDYDFIQSLSHFRSAKPRIDSEENTRLYLLLDMREYLLPNDTETQLNLLIQQLNNGTTLAIWHLLIIIM